MLISSVPVELVSENFVNNGAWKEPAVLDIIISTLKTAKAIAIFPVLTPTNLVEYANVPINAIIKFKIKTITI